MKNFLISVFFLLPLFIYGQDDGKLLLKGKVKHENKKLKNITIFTYTEDMMYTDMLTTENGKFDLELDLNMVYFIEFSKNGYVSKEYKVDTHVKKSRRNDYFKFKFTVTLFPMVKGQDLSLLNKPVEIIHFDKFYDDFDFDYDYSDSTYIEVMQLEQEANYKVKKDDAEVIENNIFETNTHNNDDNLDDINNNNEVDNKREDNDNEIVEKNDEDADEIVVAENNIENNNNTPKNNAHNETNNTNTKEKDIEDKTNLDEKTENEDDVKNNSEENKIDYAINNYDKDSKTFFSKKILCKGKITEKNKPITNAAVVLYKKGAKTPIFTSNTNSKGEFSGIIKTNNDYTILITKYGYYQKQESFSTYGFNPEATFIKNVEIEAQPAENLAENKTKTDDNINDNDEISKLNNKTAIKEDNIKETQNKNNNVYNNTQEKLTDNKSKEEIAALLNDLKKSQQQLNEKIDQLSDLLANDANTDTDAKSNEPVEQSINNSLYNAEKNTSTYTAKHIGNKQSNTFYGQLNHNGKALFRQFVTVYKNGKPVSIVSTQSDGTFSFKFEPGNKYEIKIESEGNKPIVKNIKIPENQTNYLAISIDKPTQQSYDKQDNTNQPIEEVQIAQKSTKVKDANIKTKKTTEVESNTKNEDIKQELIIFQGRIVGNSKYVSDAEVIIKQGDEIVQKTQTTKTGKYSLFLNKNAAFKIIVNKQGYNSYNDLISTYDINPSVPYAYNIELMAKNNNEQVYNDIAQNNEPENKEDIIENQNKETNSIETESADIKIENKEEQITEVEESLSHEELIFEGQVVNSDKPISGAKVAIYKNGELLTETVTKNEGKFDAPFIENYLYVIHIQKYGCNDTIFEFPTYGLDPFMLHSQRFYISSIKNYKKSNEELALEKELLIKKASDTPEHENTLAEANNTEESSTENNTNNSNDIANNLPQVIQFKGHITDKEQQTVSNAEITIFKNGIPVAVSKTKNNGEFEAQLTSESDYEIVVEKKGFKKKYINFSTKNLDQKSINRSIAINKENTDNNYADNFADNTVEKAENQIDNKSNRNMQQNNDYTLPKLVTVEGFVFTKGLSITAISDAEITIEKRNIPVAFINSRLDGYYSVSLFPNSTYNVTVSKNGYQQQEFTIKTGTETHKQNIYFEPTQKKEPKQIAETKENKPEQPAKTEEPVVIELNKNNNEVTVNNTETETNTNTNTNTINAIDTLPKEDLIYKGKIIANNKPVKEALIYIKQNDKLVSMTKASATGGYNIQIKTNSQYEITIEKNGYNTKTYKLNTEGLISDLAFCQNIEISDKNNNSIKQVNKEMTFNVIIGKSKNKLPLSFFDIIKDSIPEIDNIFVKQENNTFIYMAGSFSTIETALKVQNFINQFGYNGNIVAIKDGREIPLSELDDFSSAYNK